MKHIILTTFLIFSLKIFFAAQAIPTDPPKSNLFKITEADKPASFDKLLELESYLLEHGEMSLADLEAEDNPLLNGLSLKNDIQSNPAGLTADGPLGLPSFLWGFCLGLIGMLIVWLSTKDNEEIKKSLWGCLAGAAVSLIVGLLSGAFAV